MRPNLPGPVVTACCGCATRMLPSRARWSASSTPGIGAFHRAHQAVYTDDATMALADGDWGICGVSQIATVPRPACTRDGLYSVCAPSPRG